MSELTPEEKRRIYEEEKTRIEAQQQIKRKISRKTKPSTWGCLILIALLGIAIGITALRKPSGTGSGSTIKKTAPKREEVKLKARVTFTGTQFVIQNNNQFDWSNVRMEVNKGYYYNASRMKSLTEYTVGAGQFAKRDGTRFNPFSMKPQNFFIAADTPKGRAYYTGGWKIP